jgi:hypothetical protein
MNRLAIALVVYAALGALALVTISDTKIRLGTLAILGLFVAKTLLHRKSVASGDGE